MHYLSLALSKHKQNHYLSLALSKHKQNPYLKANKEKMVHQAVIFSKQFFRIELLHANVQCVYIV